MNEEEVTDLIQNMENISEPFKVYVRIRPFLPKECQKLRRNYSTSIITNPSFYKNDFNKSIFTVHNKTLYVLSPKNNAQEKNIFLTKFLPKKKKTKMYLIPQ